MTMHDELAEIQAAMRRAVPLGQDGYTFVVIPQSTAQAIIAAFQQLQAAATALATAAAAAGGGGKAPPLTSSYNLPLKVDIPNVSTKILGAGTARGLVLLVNMTAVNVWLGIDGSAVAYEGIPLAANGGVVQFGGPDGLPMFDQSQSLWGISESGTNTVSLQTAG